MLTGRVFRQEAIGLQAYFDARPGQQDGQGRQGTVLGGSLSGKGVNVMG